MILTTDFSSKFLPFGNIHFVRHKDLVGDLVDRNTNKKCYIYVFWHQFCGIRKGICPPPRKKHINSEKSLKMWHFGFITEKTKFPGEWMSHGS